MTVYYNEFEPYAAQTLRNLIEAGHIAPGIVDERSIEDVTPSDLRGFTQCHFFAGIGVWSYALRRAGWPDDREVWTGSTPCQPFSQAGAGAGFADERHLWPAFFHLIGQRRPAVVFGEQVASKDAEVWLDLVHTDMEALGYPFGAIPFPSAGIGAPHIRDRLYWVADTQQHDCGPQAPAANHGQPQAYGSADRAGGRGIPLGLLGDTGGEGLPPRERVALERAGWREEGRATEQSGGALGGVGQPDQEQQGWGSTDAARQHVGTPGERGESHSVVTWAGSGGFPGRAAGPVNGIWRNADWLHCRDGKWRPVEPGTFPLAHGASGSVGRSGADWRTPAGKEGFGHRVGRLRGYGNAINAAAAEAFIRCYLGT